jgi:hypothetical protein
VEAIVVDNIAAVPVEQHEYLPMRRGQRATAASDHDQMSAPINVAGQVEIVRDGDLLAASLGASPGVPECSSLCSPEHGGGFLH